jgi:hypothetical protein
MPRTDLGSSLLAAVGFGSQVTPAAGAKDGNAAGGGMFGSVQDRWLARLAVERLLRAAGLPEAAVTAAAAAAVAGQAAAGPGIDAATDAAGTEAAAAAAAAAPEHLGSNSSNSSSSRGGRLSVLGSHLSDADWQLVQAILEHQELLLQQQEQQSLAAQQQQQQQRAGLPAAPGQAAAAAHASFDSSSDDEGGLCGLGEAVEFVVRERGGISQVCMVAASMHEDEAGDAALPGPVPAALASCDGRDWGWPLMLSTWDESALHG